MWRMLLKLVAMKFVTNRLHRVGLQFMTLTERRAHMFTQSLHDEWQRMLKTLIGLFFVLACIAFSVLIAIVWLVATAWESPNRNMILGFTFLIPLLLAGGITFYIRKIWEEKIFLHLSRAQLNEDWQVLKAAMKEPPQGPRG